MANHWKTSNKNVVIELKILNSSLNIILLALQCVPEWLGRVWARGQWSREQVVAGVCPASSTPATPAGGNLRGREGDQGREEGGGRWRRGYSVGAVEGRVCRCCGEGWGTYIVFFRSQFQHSKLRVCLQVSVVGSAGMQDINYDIELVYKSHFLNSPLL